MSKPNPTNPNPEFQIIYTSEGDADGGHYATLEIAVGVLCGRLGWNRETTRLDATATKTPREWLVLPETPLKRADAPRIIEVL